MMRIEDDILARVYSFDLQFKGGKRTQFYRKLFGFKSKISRDDQEGREQVYENFYPGLLTPLPHLRLGKSVFAVPKPAEEEVDGFFEDPRWGEIDLYPFDGVLPSEDRMGAMEEVLGRIKATPEKSLRSELDSLHDLASRGDIGPEDLSRVRRVVKHSKDLMDYDWTDDSEFSERLKERIEPLEDQIG